MKLGLDYISDRMNTKKIAEEKNIVNKQRYDNIKLLFLQSDQDHAKNSWDKSTESGNIRQLEFENKEIITKVQNQKSVNNSKEVQLSNIKKEQELLYSKTLVENAQKELIKQFLSDYSEYEQPRIETLGQSSNYTELQNNLENEFNNLDYN